MSCPFHHHCRSIAHLTSHCIAIIFLLPKSRASDFTSCLFFQSSSTPQTLMPCVNPPSAPVTPFVTPPAVFVTPPTAFVVPPACLPTLFTAPVACFDTFPTAPLTPLAPLSLAAAAAGAEDFLPAAPDVMPPAAFCTLPVVAPRTPFAVFVVDCSVPDAVLPVDLTRSAVKC